MKLNDKLVSGLKAAEKSYKKSDGNGLSLVVQPSGKKLWWFRYRFEGREKTLSIGVYPIVSLREARDHAVDARKLLVSGTDPHELKKRLKSEVLAEGGETVEIIAREWFESKVGGWASSHSSKLIRRLERDVFPHLGKKKIRDVTPAVLLSVVRRVEARGKIETAHRILQSCGQVWRYAVAIGVVERDITHDLRGALKSVKSTHFGAIVEPIEIGRLLRNIDDYNGSETVRLALRLAPHLFVRPGELRHAEWNEFDFENKLWTIPGGKMKSKRVHVVPLSGVVVDILSEVKVINGDGKYLFPSPRSKTRCLSDTALLGALRRMGYEKGEMTAHGFRAMASTNLESLGYDVRIIELQLAHSDRDEVRASYKRDTSLLQLDRRREMMQKWSEWLKVLREG